MEIKRTIAEYKGVWKNKEDFFCSVEILKLVLLES